MRNESESCYWNNLRSDSRLTDLHDRPIVSLVDDQSKSISVRTRKMVNYA